MLHIPADFFQGSKICHDILVENMSLSRLKRYQDSINGAWFEHFDVAHYGVSAKNAPGMMADDPP